MRVHVGTPARLNRKLWYAFTSTKLSKQKISDRYTETWREQVQEVMSEQRRQRDGLNKVWGSCACVRWKRDREWESARENVCVWGESRGVKIIVSECCVLTTRVSGVCARYAEPCLFTHAPSLHRPSYERTKPGWSLNHDMCLHKGRGRRKLFCF